MVNILHFVDQRQRIQWPEFRAAQIQEGEICEICRDRLDPARGQPTVCSRCQLGGQYENA